MSRRFKVSSARLMRQVARANGYTVDGDLYEFDIERRAWHAEAWKVKFNHSSNYWEIWTWQDNGINGANTVEWSRAKYSLRDMDDVMDFLEIVRKSEKIRARSFVRKLKVMEAAA